ncbi:MauE/DoxX family redox-associated membrane protein [Amycolatopsis alkalitolerans]|uniref:MauE/DoxX family redox-associated membrane protein n=1 Tax=Amycolatopsis alkalitolerans TaxID=2547244 RepID=UPI001F1744AE|nr:MauE/DoxX family redox-associated membrane protein [Amycolatopsis alkalitolerans]
MNRRIALDGAGALARLGLAAVWLISGAIKVADPDQFYGAVRAYQLFGGSVSSVLAAVIPFLELALGLLLVLGLGVRLVAVLSGLLLLAYIAGVAQSWARGLTIDCGCFGGGGQVAAGQTHYGTEILRDIGFLVLAAWLTWRPRTPLSLDGLFTRRTRSLGEA